MPRLSLVHLSRWGCVALATLGLARPGLGQQVLVKPYVQPGDGGALGQADVKVICWLTDQTPGKFVVEYTLPDGSIRSVTPERIKLDFAKVAEAKKIEPSKPDATKPAPVEPHVDPSPDPTKPLILTEKPIILPPEREQRYFKYVAKLGDLPFNSDIRYRVKLAGAVVREAGFRTRSTSDQPVRFTMVGDLAKGREAQKAVAYRIAQEQPQFLVALGDIVYPAGRVSQYMYFYWRTYNDVETPGPTAGAPLMASVPFYAVLGNHDVSARLSTTPDALGAYHFFQGPKNGPGEGPWNTHLSSNDDIAEKFKAANSDSYPALAVYSFDNGPAHFVVLDSTRTSNADEPKLRAWVEADLKRSRAPWKFVCFHHPAFHSSIQHYTEQSMRLWHPLFEAGGVDVVFAGHVHNYQRTMPFTFAPTTGKRDKKGRVDGAFTLDQQFDGVKNTKPKGVIHIVSGGGGATLYGPGLDKTAATLKKDHGDNYAEFTVKHVADRHSFVMVDLTPTKLTLRAIDASGEEIDRVVIDKP